MVEPGRSVTLPPSPQPLQRAKGARRRGGLPLALGAGRSGKLVMEFLYESWIQDVVFGNP